MSRNYFYYFNLVKRLGVKYGIAFALQFIDINFEFDNTKYIRG